MLTSREAKLMGIFANVILDIISNHIISILVLARAINTYQHIFIYVYLYI